MHHPLYGWGRRISFGYWEAVFWTEKHIRGSRKQYMYVCILEPLPMAGRMYDATGLRPVVPP
jgi:hypothetical protein